MKNDSGIWGRATVQLLGPEGELKQEEVIYNLITSAGDQYYAEAGADGVGGFTKSKADPTGMKLGTNSATSPSKSGAGAVLGTYESGSNALFDTSVSVTAVGTDQGYKVGYSAQWDAGVATATLTEAIICNDAGTDLDSSVGDVYARVTFSAINKGSNDTLVINWDHTFFDDPLA